MRLFPLVFRFGASPYQWMTEHEVWRQNAAHLAAFLPPDAKRVLDLGCGPGNSTLAIAAALPDAAVFGIDLSEPMLRLAQRRRSEGWLLADAQRLPFRDGSVDAVTGHSFLYLLADRDAALAEIRRVLRPGGGIAFLEPSRMDLAAVGRAVGATLVESGPRLAFTMACWRIAVRVNGAFGPGELERTLAAAGFVDARAEPTLHGLGWIGSARKSSSRA